MSPPIVPPPMTCTRDIVDTTTLPSVFSRSCRWKTRIRFAAVGLASNPSMAAASPACGALPQLDDRVRRRIVLAPRAARDLLARLRGDVAPHNRQLGERQRKPER